jgi:hypothetical protein
MGTHPGIAAVVLEAEGWTEIPRKDNEKRYWAPPIRETFLGRAARV